LDLLTVFLRTVLIYFTVFLMLKVMGKREIGKLSLFDLVISIMIAEIAVFVIEDVHKPLAAGIVPMLTLVVIQIGLAYLTLKNEKIRRWFDGNPSYLIRNGRLNREEMRKQRYNLDDLMTQLRQNRILNVGDVEFAILEPTGKLTVIEKEKNPGHPPKEAPAVRYEGLPLPLIMDGKVQDDNLAKLGQTRFWLKNELQKRGVHDLKDVFFCSIDHQGRLFLDKKRK